MYIEYNVDSIIDCFIAKGYNVIGTVLVLVLTINMMPTQNLVYEVLLYCKFMKIL